MKKAGVVLIGLIIPLSAVVDFHQAMSGCKYYSPKLTEAVPQWRFIAQRYQDRWVNRQPSTCANIPRIIHQIWLGSPLPQKYEKFQRSWQEHHPDWQYRLWTDADVESFGLTNKAAFDAATNWGQKSDIFRYEILDRYGGLYVDCDFECLQPFDEIHAHCDFYAGVAYGAVVTLYNGLIGTVAGHPIIRRCVEHISLTPLSPDEFLNTLQTTGPMYFTRCFFDVIEQMTDRVVIFPVSYFYPWPDYVKTSRSSRIRSYITQESVAIHHWHTAWMEKNL